MPRGKIVFDAQHSPRVRGFHDDPEGTVRAVMLAHNAVYIEESLVFATGGSVGLALFKTVEGGGSETDLLGLGKALDAIEILTFIDPDRWKQEFGDQDDAAAE